MSSSVQYEFMKGGGLIHEICSSCCTLAHACVKGGGWLMQFVNIECIYCYWFCLTLLNRVKTVRLLCFCRGWKGHLTCLATAAGSASIYKIRKYILESLWFFCFICHNLCSVCLMYISQEAKHSQ